MLERINNPDKLNEDVELDRALRPRSLKEFIGQSHIKELLDISIRAAQLRGESLDHILFTDLPVWEKQPWQEL